MEVDMFREKRRKIAGEYDEGMRAAEHIHIVGPGDVITSDSGYMRGHGTYSQDGKLIATVSGVVEKVNKLICVKPIKSRYTGEVGDVVIGRVTEIAAKRWKIDTNSRLESVLMLSAVNLPGGVLRRRSAEDELMMRHYFREGDMISAEVQSIFHDGALSLHTRSLKYGKLKFGTLCVVPASLIKRCKTHFHTLPCGVQCVIGNNGYIWLAPAKRVRIGPEGEEIEEGDEEEDEEEGLDEGKAVAGKDIKASALATLAKISREERENVARVKNCIEALCKVYKSIYDTTIIYTYEASLKYPVKDLLRPDIIEEITCMGAAVTTE
eukprot:Nk52_evm28s293 gene=Nk52_evmTU28s293